MNVELCFSCASLPLATTLGTADPRQQDDLLQRYWRGPNQTSFDIVCTECNAVQYRGQAALPVAQRLSLMEIARNAARAQEKAQQLLDKESQDTEICRDCRHDKTVMRRPDIDAGEFVHYDPVGDSFTCTTCGLVMNPVEASPRGNTWQLYFGLPIMDKWGRFYDDLVERDRQGKL